MCTTVLKAVLVWKFGLEIPTVVIMETMKKHASRLYILGHPVCRPTARKLQML